MVLHRVRSCARTRCVYNGVTVLGSKDCAFSGSTGYECFACIGYTAECMHCPMHAAPHSLGLTEDSEAIDEEPTRAES